ncbi:unnamed protein product, partial [Prorocentrum cordatum]
HAFQPLDAWAKALQLAERLEDRRAILSAFVGAQRLALQGGLAKLPGSGPAGALLLACSRLGWRMASDQTLRDDLGREVDLMASSRHTLQGIVEAGLRRQLWRDAADHHEELEALRRGGAVASIRYAFLSKKATARLAACSSSARNALVGCLWP